MRKLERGTVYLGLPTSLGRSTGKAFKSLGDKIRRKLKGWKQKFLSQAGREILIKSVIQAIPTYAMSCFLFPKYLCDKLNALARSFWWGGDGDSKNICWKSWIFCTKPKKEGGLGFKDMQTFNLSLLAKQAWRILNHPSAYWVRILKGIYFPNSDFLKARSTAGGSKIWNSIIAGRRTLDLGLRKSVGTGCSIDVFRDPWILNPQTSFKPTPLYPHNSSIIKASDLISTESGSWDKRKVRSIFCKDSADSICALAISKHNSPDSWVWHYDKRGIFSVKSGYWVQLNHSSKFQNLASGSSSPSPFFWQISWNLCLPPKLRVFWWKIINDSIATKNNLWRRKCGDSGCCPYCLCALENLDHLFIHCRLAKEIWKEIDDLFQGPRGDITDLHVWIFGKMQNFSTKAESSRFLEKLVVCLWVIWLRRNEWVFRKMEKSVEFYRAKIISMWSDSAKVGSVKQPEWIANKAPRNPIPEEGNVVLIDGAWCQKSKFGAAAAVFFNNNELVDGTNAKFMASSAIMSEAWALRLAIERLIRSNLSKAWVGSDCKELIVAVNKENAAPVEVRAIVDDILYLAAGKEFSFNFVPRCFIGCADWVAKGTLSGNISHNWSVNPPSALQAYLPVGGSCL